MLTGKIRKKRKISNMNVKIDTVLYDELAVVDSSDNPVTGLVDGDFTKGLYNPSGTEVSGTVTVTISELGDGLYRVSFTPNVVGEWALTVFNATYFTGGQSMNYQCVVGVVMDIYKIEYGRWKVVGDQMIFYGEDGLTAIVTFDLKDLSGVATMQNVYERTPA